jgi:hypothetical protein
MAQAVSERQPEPNGRLFVLLIHYTTEHATVVIFAGLLLGGHESIGRLLADVGEVAEFQTQKKNHSLIPGV